ncbi:MAG: glycosyltransferase family 2 protein [Bacteroidia bacterium]|nr:glycosyltransferase family 2 protein [Bacteroidia bacterium]
MESLVSIISANFNKAPFIEDTAQTILGQSYKNWEWIIVDDGSTDNSKEILSKLAEQDSRVSVIYNNINQGANICRNQGLENASGEFVIFFDTDDLLETFCLEQRVSQAHLFPDYDMWVFSMSIFKKLKGDMPASMNWIPPKETNFLLLFLKHQLPWQTMQPLWRANKLKLLKGFDIDFVRLQDVELHTRALYNNVRVKTFPYLKNDCCYKTDEERFGNKVFKHLDGFSTGAIQFYKKFYEYANNNTEKKALSGTLLEPLSTVCYYKRLQKISKEEYHLLVNKLIDSCCRRSTQSLLRCYAFITEKSPVYPKGLKKITSLFYMYL